jgi:MerR family mercuric resistance operon transcriptional regulator
MTDVMTAPPLRIGALARHTGVSADTIRHYERLGLLGKVPRTNGGYRLFPPSAIDRVQLIQRAVRVGFSLRQLGTFLRVRQAGGAPCHNVRDAAVRILEALDRQPADLTATRIAIRAMLDDWNDRLARTPSSQPAHLLDSLGAVERSGRSTTSNLRRPR